MATPKKLPSGKWRIQFYQNGIRKSFTADTKRECMYYVAMHSEDKATASKTLRAAIDEYIENGSNLYSTYTIDGYRIIQRNYCQDIMERPISILTTEDVQKSINKEFARLSPKTIRNAYGLIKTVLKANNRPIDDIKLPKKKKHEANIPTPEDIDELLIHTPDASVRLMIMFCTYCGLRRGEALALNYEDIFTQNEMTYVRVNKAMVGTDIMPPKTESSNRIVVVPFEVPKGTGRMCTLDPKRLSDRIRKTTKGKFSVHALRHFYISSLLANKIPEFYVAKRAGHSSTKMINDTYGHIIDSVSAIFDEQTAHDMAIATHSNLL